MPPDQAPAVRTGNARHLLTETQDPAARDRRHEIQRTTRRVRADFHRYKSPIASRPGCLVRRNRPVRTALSSAGSSPDPGHADPRAQSPRRTQSALGRLPEMSERGWQWPSAGTSRSSPFHRHAHHRVCLSLGPELVKILQRPRNPRAAAPEQSNQFRVRKCFAVLSIAS